MIVDWFAKYKALLLQAGARFGKLYHMPVDPFPVNYRNVLQSNYRYRFKVDYSAILQNTGLHKFLESLL